MCRTAATEYDVLVRPFFGRAFRSTNRGDGASTKGPSNGAKRIVRVVGGKAPLQVLLRLPRGATELSSRYSMIRFPTTTLSPSWRTRKIRTSRRNRSAQNGCRIGVICPQPAIVARTAQHHPPQPARILTQGPGFSYGSVRNRGRHVAQQTCCPGVRGSKFLLTDDARLVGHRLWFRAGSRSAA
jgi:hypothetical protein